MAKVLDPGMQLQEFLGSPPLSESLLLPFLTSCKSVRLLDHIVAAGRGNHLLMLDVSQTRDLPDRGSVTAKLVGMNGLWNVVFNQQPGQEGVRSVGIPVLLKQNVEHEAVLVHSPPEPVTNTIDVRADLVQKPAGTPARFPLAQFFGEQWPEADSRESTSGVGSSAGQP